MLLAKWMIPVNVMASSVGKITKNMGVYSVPSPKPELKVSIDIMQAKKDMINISSI